MFHAPEMCWRFLSNSLSQYSTHYVEFLGMEGGGSGAARTNHRVSQWFV